MKRTNLSGSMYYEWFMTSLLSDKQGGRQLSAGEAGGKRYNSIDFILINPNFPHLTLINMVILDIYQIKNLINSLVSKTQEIVYYYL